MTPTPPVHPHQALAVYAEALVVRRRVVVFGRDESGVADRLGELGARMVVVIRPGDADEDLRPASFDLALVLDLGVFADPAVVLARARKLVGESGAALVAAANRDASVGSSDRAFEYYELYDLVAREFGDVRMVAQMPFHGLALAELGVDDESPAVTVDTQLIDVRPIPERFVALASHRGITLDPYAIVELPPPEPVETHADELIAAQTEVARERLRAEALEGQLDILRAQVLDAAELERELAGRGRVLEEREREVAALARRVLALEAAMADRDRGIATLEHEATLRAQALAQMSATAEAMRAAADAGAAAAAQVEEQARRADRAERALAMIEPELAGLAEAHGAELARFEEALRERAQAIRQLEAEAARRERMVRDLVGALDEHASMQSTIVAPEPPFAPIGSAPIAQVAEVMEEAARLRERLDAMAVELARREGEAQATSWTRAELERKLAEATASPSSRDPGVDGRLAAALDELDALRSALAQEHAQRLTAEEALARLAPDEPTAPVAPRS